MKRRNLGATNLKTSEVGLGCWPLGGMTSINGVPTTYGNVDEKMALQIITKAIDCGVNTFDTADSYSLGDSEKRLGKAFKGYRDDVYIFTKAGGVPVPNPDKPYTIDLSYHHLLAALGRSLKRLDTDYVDLFQAHAPPSSESDFENLERAFLEIKKSNMARYCGVSIGRSYQAGLQLIQRGLVDSIQLYFSMIEFEPTAGLLDAAKKAGVGIVVAEPLAQGFLTEKYRAGHRFAHDDIRSLLSPDEIDRRCKVRDRLRFLSGQSRSLSQAAISYVLKNEAVSTCIPGAKTIAQLVENVESTAKDLTDRELEEIELIHDKL